MASRESGYQQLIGSEEDARLSAQNQALRYFDNDIYSRVLGQYDSPVLLDVGCGLGDMFSFLTREMPTCEVFGFDRERRQIDLAIARHPNGKFSVLDVESDSFLGDIHEWMVREGVSGFDVINCSMVLMHLSDPVGALAKLRSLLNDSGTLIVREVDDGLQLSYPDPDGRFERLFELFAGDSRMGDRHCGRKVLAYLKSAGFGSVRLEREGLANTSMPDGMLLYEMAIPSFLDYMRTRAENAPDNETYREAYVWFEDNITEMRKCFTKKDFLFSVGFMSFTASR